MTGFSMGGAGTWHFASRFPERFSAAIPMAGRPPADIGAWKMPVLAIHSRSDEVVPIAPDRSAHQGIEGRRRARRDDRAERDRSPRNVSFCGRAAPRDAVVAGYLEEAGGRSMTEITRRDFVRTSAIGTLASAPVRPRRSDARRRSVREARGRSSFRRPTGTSTGTAVRSRVSSTRSS